MSKRHTKLKDILESAYESYNTPDFILHDPIQIPRTYSAKGDIEITAFWTSILSWGQRKTIINKCEELFALMDNDPLNFIINHQEKDRKRFENFKHRTFQYTDVLYFLEFLQWYYRNNSSLEDFFSKYDNVEYALNDFFTLFFSLEEAPNRTRKHLASPSRNSACKRLNMFLRWMVRKDSHVDLGIWNSIQPSILMMPLDVHVERVARQLQLLKRKQRDWKSVQELTNNLRRFCPEDPVKYDIALFGLGVNEAL